MHEMVGAAMQENRDVSKARLDCASGLAAAVIADGVASSEFSMRPISGTHHLSSLSTKESTMEEAMRLSPAEPARFEADESSLPRCEHVLELL